MMNNPMMGQMLGMLGSVLPKPQEPKNEVADFIRSELEKLPIEDKSIVGMIEGVLIGMANSDPNGVGRILVALHNDIGEFVTTLQEGKDGDPTSE